MNLNAPPDTQIMMETVKVTYHIGGVFIGIVFVAAFAWRVWQAMQTSIGHLLVGGIGVITSFFTWLVYAFAEPFTWLFLPVPLFFATAWLVYNGWYYYNYQHLDDWINSDDEVIQIPGMDTPVGRFLARKPGGRLVVTWPQLAAWGVAGGFFLLFGFTLTDRLNGVAQSARLAANASARVDTAVAGVEQKITGAVDAAVAPLKEGQEEIKATAAQAVLVAAETKREVKGQFSELKTKTDRATKAAHRAANESERTRRSSFVSPSPLKPTPFSLKGKAIDFTPKPADAKGRPTRGSRKQVSSNDSDSLRRFADSVFSARNVYYSKP